MLAPVMQDLRDWVGRTEHVSRNSMVQFEGNNNLSETMRKEDSMKNKNVMSKDAKILRI